MDTICIVQRFDFKHIYAIAIAKQKFERAYLIRLVYLFFVHSFIHVSNINVTTIQSAYMKGRKKKRTMERKVTFEITSE